MCWFVYHHVTNFQNTLSSHFSRDEDHEKTRTILVQNIPPFMDEEVLELFFESKKKKGGGPVKHVKLDREKNWAIVEFLEPEGIFTEWVYYF